MPNAGAPVEPSVLPNPPTPGPFIAAAKGLEDETAAPDALAVFPKEKGAGWDGAAEPKAPPPFEPIEAIPPIPPILPIPPIPPIPPITPIEEGLKVVTGAEPMLDPSLSEEAIALGESGTTGLLALRVLLLSPMEPIIDEPPAAPKLNGAAVVEAVPVTLNGAVTFPKVLGALLSVPAAVDAPNMKGAAATEVLDGPVVVAPPVLPKVKDEDPPKAGGAVRAVPILLLPNEIGAGAMEVEAAATEPPKMNGAAVAAGAEEEEDAIVGATSAVAVATFVLIAVVAADAPKPPNPKAPVVFGNAFAVAILLPLSSSSRPRLLLPPPSSLLPSLSCFLAVDPMLAKPVKPDEAPPKALIVEALLVPTSCLSFAPNEKLLLGLIRDTASVSLLTKVGKEAVEGALDEKPSTGAAAVVDVVVEAVEKGASAAVLPKENPPNEEEAPIAVPPKDIPFTTPASVTAVSAGFVPYVKGTGVGAFASGLRSAFDDGGGGSDEDLSPVLPKVKPDGGREPKTGTEEGFGTVDDDKDMLD